jgi:prevent-host-death family protein
MKTKLVTTFKHQATKSLTELPESKETVLITKQGRPSVYLIEVDDYELMQSSMN